MSSFTSVLIVSPQPNGKDWKLARSFTYHIGSKYSQSYIRVPAGFITDFATIPKCFLWWLPYWAKYQKAPVIHDWLYNVKKIMGNPITQKKADDIFLEAMLIEWRHHKSRRIIAYMEYFAVRLFGGLYWSSFFRKRI